MLTVFFDHKDVVHHEHVLDGQTVNREYYVEVVCRLHDVQHKRPASWKQGDWQLDHNNTPPPPTCPTFFLLPNMKMLLKGNRFQDNGGDKMKRNDAAVGCSKESVP
jgi:hypothetical protein